MFKQSIFQSRTMTGNEVGYWVGKEGHAKPFYSNLELIFFFRSTKRNAKKRALRAPNIWSFHLFMGVGNAIPILSLNLASQRHWWLLVVFELGVSFLAVEWVVVAGGNFWGLIWNVFNNLGWMLAVWSGVLLVVWIFVRGDLGFVGGFCNWIWGFMAIVLDGLWTCVCWLMYWLR